MAAWQCLLQAARLALPRRHRISAAGKNRRSREVCRRQKSQTSGGFGLTDGSVAVPVASRKACSAEAPPYFCRRQKSQKPGGLPQAKIAEAGRFAAGKNRRSREVCRRQKSQTSGGPGLTEMCASVPTRTSNPSRRPSKAYLRARRYRRARLLWLWVHGTALFGAIVPQWEALCSEHTAGRFLGQGG